MLSSGLEAQSLVIAFYCVCEHLTVNAGYFFMLLLPSADFSKSTFKKNFQPQMVWILIRTDIPDLAPSYLPMLSTEDKSPSARKVTPGFIQSSISKIQGLLKASPTVFKDLKLIENMNLSNKILLWKC